MEASASLKQRTEFGRVNHLGMLRKDFANEDVMDLGIWVIDAIRKKVQLVVTIGCLQNGGEHDAAFGSDQ
jgi:hypothetical protein